jgi:hypothetical protein
MAEPQSAPMALSTGGGKNLRVVLTLKGYSIPACYNNTLAILQPVSLNILTAHILYPRKINRFKKTGQTLTAIFNRLNLGCFCGSRAPRDSQKNNCGLPKRQPL